MLFSYDTLDAAEQRALARIQTLRRDLRLYVSQDPRRWTGLLARWTRARALRASNSIEGINVSYEDAIAAVDGENPANADKATWQAVLGYRRAMDYILQRCRDSAFRFTKDVILTVHFLITEDDLSANPGNWRPGWVGVRNTTSGEIVHEGADRDLLEPLMDELVALMNAPEPPPTLIRAAITHLNVAMIHPFSDGNGRTARCLQTAVLAQDGVVTPLFSSIEEYIGRNQQRYYDVLAEVGGGSWDPRRDCRPWVRFCLEAHYRQAQTVLRRHREFERVYGELRRIALDRAFNERVALAMLEAAYGIRVRNASYRVSADISNNLASRDLKDLVDAGFLRPQGEKRGREYVATPELRAIRERYRTPRANDDPFADDAREEPKLPF